MIWKYFVLVFLVVVSQCANQNGADQLSVYVLPTNSTSAEFLPCRMTTCYTLSNLSSNYTLETNATLILLPGTHTIDSNNSTIYINNVNNISIVGQYSSLQNNISIPKIECMQHNAYLINVQNVTGLLMSNFEIIGCKGSDTFTNNRDLKQLSASIKIVDASNVRIQGVNVHHGDTIGLLILQPQNYIGISNSEFSKNQINCFIQLQEESIPEANSTEHTTSRKSNQFQLMIINSTFQFGKRATQKYTSGLYTEISVTTFTFQITFTNLTVDENQNGDMQLNLSSPTHLSSYVNIQTLASTNSVHNCGGIEQSRQCYGLSIETRGSINIFVSDVNFIGTCMGVFTEIGNNSTLRMTRVTFQDTQCKGTALSLGNVKNGIIDDLSMFNSRAPILGMLDSNVTLQGTFINNTGGVIVYDSMLHFAANSETRFENNDCTATGSTHCSTLEVDSSVLNFYKGSHLIFKNNTGSSSGAISLNHGTMHVHENVTLHFDRNSGTNGGAVSMYAGSKVLVCDFSLISIWEGVNQCKGNKSNFTFIGNRASERGGAVYADDSGFINKLSGLTELFLKTRLGVATSDQLDLYFIDNQANIAGSAFYGGWLIYYNPQIFHYKKDLSVISSDPVRVCMCVSSLPRCNITEYNVEAYPGESFNISVVVVGQRLGTVPSTVNAILNSTQNQSRSILLDGQYVQNTNVNCTSLKYTVFSINPVEILALITKKHNVPNLKRLQKRLSYYESMREFYNELGMLMEELSVAVTLKSCPVGFAINDKLKMCHCDPILVDHQINDCDIETLKIFRTGKKWINATFTHIRGTESSYGVIVHDYCPFDYCRINVSHVRLEAPDDQCAFNRSGILCGACGTNFSDILGTSKCRRCSNLWVLLVVPAFITSGILLVILLISLNLTVSSGFLNGLIFYANIIRANELNTGFFHSNICFTIFIAWLNLDSGIETCFYNGLDAYAKTWFQFLFPVYIWAIALTIIVTSRYYTFAARLCGSNVVQVLATLFLLSYAKLIRTIITIFQSTVLVYPDGYKRRVWLYNGNVDYLKGKHLPLFIAALLVLLCLSIPYTVSLLFIQWLRRYNHYRILRWVGKLKPLFDAYTGPFKEKHCYWFGVLLLVRVALYVVFSLNISGNSSVNLMAIGITSICVLAYLTQIGGAYTSWAANLLESLFVMNLGILSLGTYSYQNQQKISTVSLSVAFFLFVLILLYHAYIRVIQARRGKKVKETKDKLKEKLKLKLEMSLSTEKGKQLKTFLTPPVQTKPQIRHTSIQLREPLLKDVENVIVRN